MNRFAYFCRVSAVIALATLSMIAVGQMTKLPNSVVPTLGASRVVGVVSPYQSLGFTVSLKPRFPDELEAAAESVSNPTSRNYRQWLTPYQVGLQFGATSSTVNSVVNYFRSRGMTIVLTSPNRMAILVRGTVGQIQNAFQTTLKNYSGPDPLGTTINFRANATPLSVPTAIAPYVQAVTGIDNWVRPHPATQTLTPFLAENLYNVAPAFALGFQGQGMKIGISNWDGFQLSNVPLFVSNFGLPAPGAGAGSNVHVITLNGGSQGNPPGGEGDLDIQMELGTAPLADIYIYDDGAGDLVGTLTREASDNLCDIISESWGWGLGGFPSEAEAAHNQHLAMTLQGMTYMAASGDSGTDWPVSLPYPDADPEVLSVGGTIATVNDTTGARQSEVGWAGSGGGWSNSGFSFDKRPSWQHGPGIPSQPDGRLQPDIGLQAGGPGAFVIYYQGSQVAFDGTSCASPCNAGGLAIVEQRLAAQNVTPRLGRVQDLFYQQAGRSDVWYDVTQGSNGTLLNGQQSNAGPGWDFVTGWGAPNFDGLYNSLLQAVTSVPYYPDNISTAIGTYEAGDATSVAASDGVTYQVNSQGVALFGEAAGVYTTFHVPTDTVALSLDIQVGAGVTGGTNMMWLYNWVTDRYVYVGATPMDSTAGTDRVVKIRQSDVSQYVGPSGEVDAIIRGHIPLKPFNNTMPPPFTYQLDLVELLAR